MRLRARFPLVGFFLAGFLCDGRTKIGEGGACGSEGQTKVDEGKGRTRSIGWKRNLTCFLDSRDSCHLTYYMLLC